METFSALLALCAVNSPVTGEFPSQRPVMCYFVLVFSLIWAWTKGLSKQSRRQWFQTPPRSSWRHCNVIIVDPPGSQYNVILPISVHWYIGFPSAWSLNTWILMTLLVEGLSMVVYNQWDNRAWGPSHWRLSHRRSRFAFNQMLTVWSLQNFAHAATAMLSWHVQKMVASR